MCSLHSCSRESCVAGRATRRPCLSAVTLCTTATRWTRHFFITYFNRILNKDLKMSAFTWVLLKSRDNYFSMVSAIAEKIRKGDFRGGDIFSPWPRVHPSIGEKRLSNRQSFSWLRTLPMITHQCFWTHARLASILIWFHFKQIHGTQAMEAWLQPR